jgi:hypothetical protein
MSKKTKRRALKANFIADRQIWVSLLDEQEGLQARMDELGARISAAHNVMLHSQEQWLKLSTGRTPA